MRILFLTQTFPRSPVDTSGPFIRDLARGLIGHGDEVTVLTPHAEGVAERWEDGGVEVRSFRYAPVGSEVLGYSRSLSADEKVRWRAGLVTPLYLWGARRAVSAMLRERDYDVLQGHWVVPNGLVTARFADRLVVGTGLHGSDVFMAERAGVRSWVGRSLRRCSFLTGCSPELVDRVCALGFPRERAAVIPYGVDVELFSPDPARREVWRRRLGIPADAVLALSVGRMVSKKGYQVLLPLLPELLAAHDKLHVVLAGAGDLLDEFRRQTEAWSGRVHLPGIVLRDTLPDLYRAADVFVLPAVHDAKGNVDGLPNVILEAMASGLPVVASGISGIPLAITDGVEGRLVKERDGAQLAGVLGAVVADAEVRRAMGQAARRKAVAELTWRVVAARYRAAYQAGLASAGRMNDVA
ncbi:MAG: glycosyltransferase [Acidobacteria bacterium]|nr:glycosyltransferase [Acidobacteriota bacterium]